MLVSGGNPGVLVSGEATMALSRMTNYRVNVQLKKGLENENENGSKGTLLCNLGLEKETPA